MRRPARVLALHTIATFLIVSAAQAQPFRLTSPDVKPNGRIAEEQVFNGFGCSGKNISPALRWSGAPPGTKSFGCSGKNISPALRWSGAPPGTKSFALLVHDPDAPTGGAGWWHWLVIDIPADVTALKKDAGKADGANLPSEATRQIGTDFGTPGWGGPCPPAGAKAHHYHFTLYALKVEKLDVPNDARASLVGFMVNANSIAKATLTGVYGRAK